YADILLMYAEAQNEASGPNSSVYDAINEVRARAGMPDVATGLTKEGMRTEIRHERRIEFVAEGLRYSDIRRWKIAETVMVNGKGYDSGKLSDPTDPASWVFEVIDANGRVFSAPKDYVWPLPQSEIQTNKKLLQNPAWN
ncbi:MAG: RagB/SusD family nutrient uptake outer membrane protein, partial [Mariniphaga sp.]